MIRTLINRNTGERKEFYFARLSLDKHLNDVLYINHSVKSERIDVSVFSAPSNREIYDSFVDDIVIGAFDGDELVAFMILIHDRGEDRDLSRLAKYRSEECMSIDNIEVLMDSRGFGIEKVLLGIAKAINSEPSTQGGGSYNPNQTVDALGGGFQLLWQR